MNKLFKDVHWPIFFCVLAITFSSFLFIYSATFRGEEHYMYKQLSWLIIAIIAFWFVVGVGYRSFLNVSYLIYWFSVLLLVLVFVIGHTRHGAQRWIPIGSFALQPSEFCKLGIVLTLAHFLSEQTKTLGQKRSFILGSFLVLLPFVLILKQPDLGTAILLIPIFFIMLFMWGIRIWYLVSVIVMGILTFPLGWLFLKSYQKKRLLVFLNPNADPLGSGYTALQSKIAVGSGGLIGKGWLHGTQTQLDFVPEHHTDFIFCVSGEEFGFFGSLVLILLFCLLVRYALQIIERTTDQKARLLACGVTAMIFFQMFVNVGMTIGLTPITGVTLPMVSYGGSSLIVSFMGAGFLASIHKERSIF